MPEVLTGAPRERGPADGLPSVFVDPHPTAVASLGDEYVTWVESTTGTRLRWWQWLTAQRRYEVDADGRWCWLLGFTSVSRQQGKSIELTRDAAWSGARGGGGETLHAAHRVTTSRNVQAELWPWADRLGLRVARQLGDSRITWPDGSYWRTVAMESAYGERPHRLLVDEAWAMDPVQFFNALFPALGGQDTPVQALFWSAANPTDHGLVADLRADPRVCRMEWGALPGEDHADRRVWQAASAFWNPGREALMDAAHGRPGFAENWLNVWPQQAGAEGRWTPRAVTDLSAARVGIPPPGAVCAVECTPDGRRWAVAAAWPHRTRQVRARVWHTNTLADALARVGERRVYAHVAVARMPDLVGRRVVAVTLADGRAATTGLREVLAAGGLHVAGIDDGEWAAVRTLPADGGELISAPRSVGDVHAVKALSWAVWAVQSERNHPGLVM